MRAPTSWPSARPAVRRWRRPLPHLTLEPGQAHLWRARLEPRTDVLPRLAGTLGPDERAKAARFRFEHHRDEYVLAHGILRSILATYLNAIPGDLTMRCRPGGAPVLASGGLWFSMSRSRGLALFAVARDGALGVDIEAVRPGVATDLARCISPAGRRALDAIPGSARRRALFQGWSRLEAYAKASGEGLDAGLEVFERFLGRGRVALVVSRGDAQRSWRIRDFNPGHQYVGALAAPPHLRRVRCFQWRYGPALHPHDASASPASSLPPHREVQDEDLSA